jgi:hypothetical protein
MSGSRQIWTAKARRTYIPLEYVVTGWSMNSPMSAKAAISSKRAAVCSRVSPEIAALRNTFSRPVNCGLKPDPSSSSAVTRPFTSTEPSVAAWVPTMRCSSVDLPEPFLPTMPTVSPRRTSKDTSRRAQNGVWYCLAASPARRCSRG